MKIAGVLFAIAIQLLRGQFSSDTSMSLDNTRLFAIAIRLLRE